MPTRREFLLSTASAIVLLTVGGCAALGGALDNAVESAAAVTCVFGDGMRQVAVAVKYRADVSAAVLEPSQYGVAWRGARWSAFMWRKVPLYQGNGAIAWASPEFQAQHPCFVIAPEFDEIIVDDTSTASNYLDATINLIKHLKTKLPIDGKRLYTTGQSGGGMISIALPSAD
ncbi:TPA: Tat pathway signal protein, partial [Neisseria subflava]